MSIYFNNNYPGIHPQAYITACDWLNDIASDIKFEENCEKKQLLIDKMYAKCKELYSHLQPFEETIYDDIADRNGEDRPITMLPYNEEEDYCLQAMYIICNIYHNLGVTCDNDTKSQKAVSKENFIIECSNDAMFKIMNDKGYVRYYLERFVERLFHEYDLDKFDREASKEKWAKLLTYMLEDCERPDYKDTPISFLPDLFRQNQDIITRQSGQFYSIMNSVFHNIPYENLEDEILRYLSMQRAIELVHIRVRPDIRQNNDVSYDQNDYLDIITLNDGKLNSEESNNIDSNLEIEEFREDEDKLHSKWFVKLLNSKAKGETDGDKKYNKLKSVSKLYAALKERGAFLSDPTEDLFIYRLTGLMRKNVCFDIDSEENIIKLSLSNSEIGYIFRCLISDDINGPSGLSNVNKYFVSKTGKSMNLAVSTACEIKNYDEDRKKLPSTLCKVIDMLKACGFINVEKMYSKGERGEYQKK